MNDNVCAFWFPASAAVVRVMTLTQVSLVVSAKSGIAPTVVDAEEDILNDAKNRIARVTLATAPMRLVKLEKNLVILFRWYILF